ncbi:hypothetical protein ZIOFF_038264 [Zingiber officinale]|uniref:Uncharacterized protein n=1 Tax=Zingiber officinale TaxID=94328 RepID=A0A8J5G9N6_ZINOF|nr:hypothetical protein ZIOFF_038264 [Zingiber officinale]
MHRRATFTAALRQLAPPHTSMSSSPPHTTATSWTHAMTSQLLLPSFPDDHATASTSRARHHAPTSPSFLVSIVACRRPLRHQRLDASALPSSSLLCAFRRSASQTTLQARSPPWTPSTFRGSGNGRHYRSTTLGLHDLLVSLRHFWSDCRDRRRRLNLGASGALYTLIAAATGCQWIYLCFYRSKLRAQYKLPESPCCDCCVHFWCESCALCQEYRELQARGFDMTIG